MESLRTETRDLQAKGAYRSRTGVALVTKDTPRSACTQAGSAQRDTHRWPRATVAEGNYGRVCECGNLKTDQALTCSDCAVERRRAPDYWERTTCECGGAKSKRARRCLRCEHDRRRADPGAWDFGGSSRGAADHPWRKREELRRAA